MPGTREYTNLSIRMRDFDGEQFAVEVTESPVGRMRHPEWSMLDSGGVPLLQKLDERNDKGDDELPFKDLRELGEILGGMLFPQTVREIFRKSAVLVARRARLAARSGAGRKPSLRIVLNIDDTILMSLPWE